MNTVRERVDAFYEQYPEPYQESEDIQGREVALLKELLKEQGKHEAIDTE